MKGFKKLALASAICATPLAATAMEAIEDEALSEITGQDGITITADVSLLGMDVAIEDDDGLTGATAFTGALTHGVTYDSAGVLLLNGLDVQTSVTIDIDSAGDEGTSTGSGLLNVFIATTTDTNIAIGSIEVADSDGAGNHGVGDDVIIFNGGAGTTVSIASGMLIDVELGNEEANFATINGSIGTISVGTSDLAGNGDGNEALQIVDGGLGENNLTGGSIWIDYVAITGVELINMHANIVATGLTINTGQGLTNVGLTLLDVAIGSTGGAAQTIGDIYVSGLDLSDNTITITGH